jgi:hypothetical protein
MLTQFTEQSHSSEAESRSSKLRPRKEVPWLVGDCALGFPFLPPTPRAVVPSEGNHVAIPTNLTMSTTASSGGEIREIRRPGKRNSSRVMRRGIDQWDIFS